MSEQYICKIASPDEVERKWAYEIRQQTADRENWIVWRDEALTEYRMGHIIPYYGILDGNIICEATAVIHPDAAQNGIGLIDDHTAYLCAFRTNEPFRGRGYFSRLFSFMISDLQSGGYTRATLGVEPEDLKNKKLYEHYGFTRYIRTGNETFPDGTVIRVEYYAKELTGSMVSHM